MSGPLSARYERVVVRAWRKPGADGPVTWELVLSCGHGAIRHRLREPPKKARCALCAKEKP